MDKVSIIMVIGFWLIVYLSIINGVIIYLLVALFIITFSIMLYKLFNEYSFKREPIKEKDEEM